MNIETQKQTLIDDNPEWAGLLRVLDEAKAHTLELRHDLMNQFSDGSSNVIRVDFRQHLTI